MAMRTRTPLPQANAHLMIRRRSAAAGIATKLGNHSFRATGITTYLKNGGTVEKGGADGEPCQHARTTRLHDRQVGTPSRSAIRIAPESHMRALNRLHPHIGRSGRKRFPSNAFASIAERCSVGRFEALVTCHHLHGHQ